MSINQLLTNYNNLSSGTLFIPSSGSGNGGGGGTGIGISTFNALYASTFIANTTGTAIPDSIGLTIQASENSDPPQGLIQFQTSASQAAYNLNVSLNGVSSKYDMILQYSSAVATGNLNFGGSMTGIVASNANMLVSSINGLAIPTGDPAVQSITTNTIQSFSTIGATVGDVVLTLGTKAAIIPPGDYPAFTFQTQNSENNSGAVINLNFDTNGGTGGWRASQLGPGYYFFSIPNLSIKIAQNTFGESFTSAAIPGSVLQHFILVGNSATSQLTKCYLESYILQPIPATDFGLLYAQTTVMNLQGIIYSPAALGTWNTLELRCYFNGPTGTFQANGAWSYSGPPDSYAANQAILLPLLGV